MACRDTRTPGTRVTVRNHNRCDIRVHVYVYATQHVIVPTVRERASVSSVC